MREFKSKVEEIIPAEELLFDPTPGFGEYREFLEHAVAHPAKMNTKLLEFLVKKFTKRGDVVLDPMAGTGSTGVVAALHGRNAICVDIEEKFYKWMEEARRRIEEHQTLAPKGKIINICGDARRLSSLLEEADILFLRGRADLILTSPPYSESLSKRRKGYTIIPQLAKTRQMGEDTKDENIANFPHGSIDTIITSPPYSEGIGHEAGPRASETYKWRLELQRRYTETMRSEGNIAKLRHGDIDAIITQPKLHSRGRFKIIDEKWLRKRYLVDKKTMQEIADELGVSRTCVRNNIYRYKIPVIEQWQRHFDGRFCDLEEEQQQILLGTLLGDANISRSKGSKYHQLRLCHSEKQLEYLKWKIFMLQEFFKAEPYVRCDGRGRRYQVTSVSHPIFTELYNLFYVKGKKALSKKVLDKVSELGLAVWLMDDGFLYGANKKKGWKGNLALSTACYSRNEHELLVRWFKEKWGIKAKIHTRSDGHLELHFPGEASRKLKKLIAPYVLPMFEYKLDISRSRSEAKREYWKQKKEKPTYLSEMLKVYSECFKVLKPNGLMIVVVKPFIRNKEPVDLPYHTWLLMRKVGFKLEKIYKLRLKQQSFWRLLYYRRHPNVPRLNHEYILICRKPLEP